MILKRLCFVLLAAASCIGCKESVIDRQNISSFEKGVPVWAEGRETEVNLTLAFRTVIDYHRDAEQTGAEPRLYIPTRKTLRDTAVRFFRYGRPSASFPQAAVRRGSVRFRSGIFLRDENMPFFLPGSEKKLDIPMIGVIFSF